MQTSFHALAFSIRHVGFCRYRWFVDYRGRMGENNALAKGRAFTFEGAERRAWEALSELRGTLHEYFMTAVGRCSVCGEFIYGGEMAFGGSGFCGHRIEEGRGGDTEKAG